MDPADTPAVFLNFDVQAAQPGSQIVHFTDTLILLQTLAPLHPGSQIGVIVELLQFWVAQDAAALFGPHMQDYPPLAVFDAAMHDCMVVLVNTIMSTLEQTIPAGWLDQIATLFGIYTLRFWAVRQDLGADEPDVDIIAHVRQLLEPVFVMAQFMATHINTPVFVDNIDMVALYLTSIGISLGALHGRVVGGDREVFYRGIRMHESASMLACTYVCIQRSDLETPVPLTALLTNFELAAEPKHFADLQTLWIKDLWRLGLISSNSVHIPSAQLVSLRSPASMVPEVRSLCWCRGCTTQAPFTSRRCSHCRRVFYCSAECQRQ
ncbi:unnamed protein product [Peniophora sp. CBMAI 1063]|nr:unnamed protein product [Peniophora sp. CBMAI 1063]